MDLLDGVVVVVVVSELPDFLRVKPKGRGCDTAAIVDLFPNVVAVVVVVAVNELELLLTVAGTVVNNISVAESSTSFTESVVEPMVFLTLIVGLSGGSTLITVITSVEVEVVVAGEVELLLPAVVPDASEYSSSLVAGVVSLITSVGDPMLDESSEVLEVVLLNLWTLVYLKYIYTYNVRISSLYNTDILYVQ